MCGNTVQHFERIYKLNSSTFNPQIKNKEINVSLKSNHM